jgi:hypothetical protein
MSCCIRGCAVFGRLVGGGISCRLGVLLYAPCSRAHGTGGWWRGPSLVRRMIVPRLTRDLPPWWTRDSGSSCIFRLWYIWCWEFLDSLLEGCGRPRISSFHVFFLLRSISGFGFMMIILFPFVLPLGCVKNCLVSAWNTEHVIAEERLSCPLEEFLRDRVFVRDAKGNSWIARPSNRAMNCEIPLDQHSR